MKWLNTALLLCVTTLLAACVSSDPEPLGYTVSSVEVSVAPEANLSERAQEQGLASTIPPLVQAQLVSRFAQLESGPTPARAIVVLDTLVVRTAGARTFAGASTLSGTVQIVDAAGNALAPAFRATAEDRGGAPANLNGNPLVGLVINAAANADRAASGRDLEQLTAAFARNAVDSVPR